MTRTSRTALALAAVPLIVVAIACILLKLEAQLLTRDVASIGEVHPLAGFLSSLGVLLWGASAALWFLTGRLLRDGAEDRRFCFATGSLAAYLCLDDLFQLHEYLIPQYAGIPEIVVLAGVAGIAAMYVVRYRTKLFNVDSAYFWLAGGFLAASIGADIADQWLWRLRHWVYFLEDGLKWLGISMWFCFAFKRCSDLLAHELRGDRTHSEQLKL